MLCTLKQIQLYMWVRVRVRVNVILRKQVKSDLIHNSPEMERKCIMQIGAILYNQL